jgi:hypothetical protein
MPYWTDATHVCEMVVAAMPYVCPEDDIGFRYENPIALFKDRCETMSQFPLAIEEID